jgi:hypothetical protein
VPDLLDDLVQGAVVEAEAAGLGPGLGGVADRRGLAGESGTGGADGEDGGRRSLRPGLRIITANGSVIFLNTVLIIVLY